MLDVDGKRCENIYLKVLIDQSLVEIQGPKKCK